MGMAGRRSLLRRSHFQFRGIVFHRLHNRSVFCFIPSKSVFDSHFPAARLLDRGNSLLRNISRRKFVASYSALWPLRGFGSFGNSMATCQHYRGDDANFRFCYGSFLRDRMGRAAGFELGGLTSAPGCQGIGLHRRIKRREPAHQC
jgi:hypothetical protein